MPIPDAKVENGKLLIATWSEGGVPMFCQHMWEDSDASLLVLVIDRLQRRVDELERRLTLGVE